MHWINLVFFAQSLCSWSLGLRQVIIKPREKISQGYKESVEAELSYLTEKLGFVDDENVQHSGTDMDPATGKTLYMNPAEKFLHEFVYKYLQGNTAYDTPITQGYFEKPELSMRLCPTYLRDPIFDYNGIDLILDTVKHPSLYELKFVEFQYFTRKTELVKVVRCPVRVGDFETRLYFLEISYNWSYVPSLRGYFVFINKVVSLREQRQPLQLLMYIDPDLSVFPEMKTAGNEAKLHDSVDLVSSRTMKLRLRERKPLRSYTRGEVWTARTIIDKMEKLQEKTKHYFGEEAEIMLLAKFYGFFDFLSQRARPWRMKKTLLILDSMAKDFAINREKMDAVKKTDAQKTCRNYILLNDELKKRRIVPRTHLHRARYVTKLVEFTQFDYPASIKPRELLLCPIRYGRDKEPRNMYLLPIHYENAAKLPQLFTFFENPDNREIVRVYILSPVPAFVDDVADDFVVPDVEDLTQVPFTSDSHHSQTASDSETSTTFITDLSSVSHPGGSDVASSSTGPRDLDTAPFLSHTDSLPAYPGTADPGRHFQGR